MTPNEANSISETAFKRITELLHESASREEEKVNVQAKLAVVQIAALYPSASIGNCAIDGTSLHFEGRKNGLFVCCAGHPTHCWKV